MAILASACTAPEAIPESQPAFVPSEVIDLGALVTEDLPDRVWGKALLEQRGYTRSNVFEVVPHEGITCSGGGALLVSDPRHSGV